jgi:hypothetical protein
VRLRNLELRHGTRGDLRTADGQFITGTYTLVDCLSHDARLQQAFLELATDLLRKTANWQHAVDVERSFSSMVELFQAASLPSPSSWIGVWGELFLMHASPRPEKLLACWHVDPFKLHDFALGTDRLECKTTVGQGRVHDFSLTQLFERDRTVYVASVITHESLSGISALTLYDEVRRTVRVAELRVHLDKVVTSILGESLNSNWAPKYDYQEALKTLKIFSARVVPAPSNPLPDLVSSVRFRSDLSSCDVVSKEADLLRFLV